MHAHIRKRARAIRCAMAATNAEQAGAVYSFAAVGSPFLKTVPQPVLAMAANFFDFAGSGEIGTMAAPAPYGMARAGVFEYCAAGYACLGEKSACGMLYCRMLCAMLRVARHTNKQPSCHACLSASLFLCSFVRSERVCFHPLGFRARKRRVARPTPLSDVSLRRPEHGMHQTTCGAHRTTWHATWQSK